MIQRVTATESKFTQQLEKLDNRYMIVWGAIGATRSASSTCNENYGVMHGELYYTGSGPHTWRSKTDD